MNIYFDGHCDTLKKAFDEKKKLDFEEYDFNLKYANMNNIVIQNLAAFVHTDFDDGYKRAKEIINYYFDLKNDCILVTSNNDLNNIIINKKVGVVFSIENGKAIENDINNIEYFYSIGVKMMGITWNDDNLLGCGCFSKNDKGLSVFGIKYVKKLEEKNIIIDVSHASEKTFWDTIKNTNKTIVATHSNCYELCNHPRNLKDAQIREIAKRDGIIGICFASPFLINTGVACVDDLIKHISYIINLVGEDYVGLGSDFDGLSTDNKMMDIVGVKDISLLENGLKKYGYSKKTINKIMGENWLRVLNKVL